MPSATGFPHPRFKSAPSGTEANSPLLYPICLLVDEPPQQPHRFCFGFSYFAVSFSYCFVYFFFFHCFSTSGWNTFLKTGPNMFFTVLSRASTFSITMQHTSLSRWKPITGEFVVGFYFCFFSKFFWEDYLSFCVYCDDCVDSAAFFVAAFFFWSFVISLKKVVFVRIFILFLKNQNYLTITTGHGAK